MLLENRRNEISHARANGMMVDRRETTPEPLANVGGEADAGVLVGRQHWGEWELDGIAIREPTRPAVEDALFVPECAA